MGTVESHNNYQFINGAGLKWVAILTMLVDHTAVVLVQPEQNPMLYTVMRLIGRLAFPIFCFLITEGFYHTSNRKNYAIRLALFALISEVSFDLALQNEAFDWAYQNVYFTLLFGLLAIWALDYYKNKKESYFAGILIAVLLCLAAEILQTDYGAYGVSFIIFFYLTHSDKVLQLIIGSLLALGQATAIFSMPLIYAYNAERGTQPKYLFYWFYPGHLLILALIRLIITA